MYISECLEPYAMFTYRSIIYIQNDLALLKTRQNLWKHQTLPCHFPLILFIYIFVDIPMV